MALKTTSMSDKPKEEDEKKDFEFVKNEKGQLAVRKIRDIKEVKAVAVAEKKEIPATPVKTQTKRFTRGKK